MYHPFALFLQAAATCVLSSSLLAAPTPLFDGKSFEGWEENTSGIWRVENGQVVAGSPDSRQPKNDFLCTTREYGNFDLRAKYKRGRNNGGIQFWSRRIPGSHELSGFQADFSPKIDGFLYDESRRKKFMAQPGPETIAQLKLPDNLDEWVEYHVRAEGSRIRLWINNILTVDYTEEDPAIPRSGIIGLQIHSGATEIRYKDIVLEELEPQSGPDAPKTRSSLFQGRNLSGWHYKDEPDLGEHTAATDGRYSATDGHLVVNREDPDKGPHLRQLWTTRTFPKDFTLRLEFRAEHNADSGIFIRGKQLQCRDYWVAGPYYRLKKYRYEDWNKIEIVVKGTTAYCTCNGEVLEARFLVPEDGPIGLEADRGELRYRNLEIEESPF